ncbi:hypothetical protein BDW75DRAFT_188821 [Aspergillus navahoensis]
MLAQPCYHCGLEALLHPRSSYRGMPPHLLLVLSICLRCCIAMVSMGLITFAAVYPSVVRLQGYHSVAFTIHFRSHPSLCIAPLTWQVKECFPDLGVQKSCALFVSRAVLFPMLEDISVFNVSGDILCYSRHVYAARWLRTFFFPLAAHTNNPSFA